MPPHEIFETEGAGVHPPLQNSGTASFPSTVVPQVFLAQLDATGLCGTAVFFRDVKGDGPICPALFCTRCLYLVAGGSNHPKKKQQTLGNLEHFLHGHFCRLFQAKTWCCPVVCYDLFFFASLFLKTSTRPEKKKTSYIKTSNKLSTPKNSSLHAGHLDSFWSPQQTARFDRCEAVSGGSSPGGFLASVRSIHHLRIELHIFFRDYFVGLLPKKTSVERM